MAHLSMEFTCKSGMFSRKMSKVRFSYSLSVVSKRSIVSDAYAITTYNPSLSVDSIISYIT